MTSTRIMSATRIPTYALALCIGLVSGTQVLAQTAKGPKPKQQAAARDASRPKLPHWGTDKFRAGPLYHGTDYLGDDPDPFIRLQIQRDLSHRYGGDD